MTRYAYRLETRRVKEQDFPYLGSTLSSPKDVYLFARALQNSDIEKFMVLHLNTLNRLICIQIQEGTLDRAAIYPREIAKHCLLAGSASVVLVHNHPSGRAVPSPEDKHMTQLVFDALKVFDIRVLDHLILGEGESYFSFADSHIIPL